MKYLPLAMTQGPLLSQVVRDLHKDPRRPDFVQLLWRADADQARTR